MTDYNSVPHDQNWRPAFESVQFDPSTAKKSVNGLPEKRATLDQPPSQKDVSGGALAAAAAATIASVVGISWLVSKLVKRARSG